MGLVMLLILSLVMAPPFAESQQVDEWQEGRYGVGSEKVTRLHLYLHDQVSGKNPSAVKVADHPNTKNSPSYFGFLAIADDPLTEGPEPTSKTLGRAQGLVAFASREEMTEVLSMSFAFTEGEFKGSSLSILGGNQVLQPVREMPIIGGTGIFRFARGLAVAKTYWANVTTCDLIEEYHLTVLHYSNGDVSKEM